VFAGLLFLFSILAGLLVLPTFWEPFSTESLSPEFNSSGPSGTNVATNTIIKAPAREYSDETFAAALRQELGSEQASLVVNPLASTPEMDRWARELVAGATNELQKAKILFDVLVGRFSRSPAQFPRPPTAQEAFASRAKPDTSLGCQEFAFLYVALARAVGLKSFHVFVDQDCRGMKCLHGCASVFLEDKALLVDPAYLSFGAAHKKFAVLDDLQTAALYACGAQELTLCEIACKLAPNFVFAQGSLFHLLVRDGHWEEARKHLPILVRLDSEGPMTLAAEARLAAHDGKLEKAIDLLQKAVKMAPQTYQVYVFVGNIYAQQSRWSEAREAYQNALRYSVYENVAEDARHGVAYMGALECQARGDWSGALSNYDRALELRPRYAEAYAGRGVARASQGDWDGALADCNKAIELKPGLAPAYFYRGSANCVSGNFDAALADYMQAIRFDPKMAWAYRMCGQLRYQQHDFKQALADLQKADELGLSDDDAHFHIWLARSRLGEMTEATKELQIYLRDHTTSNSDPWSSRVGSFLLGRMSESDLLTAADSEDKSKDATQHCEAWYYAGSKRLIDGDISSAIQHFKRSASAGISNLLECTSAAAELRFLNSQQSK
jgi:tetratricopeptide (TPR) repeat protein